MEIGGIILAGGKSSRLKTNKCLLEFDGFSLIERTIKTLEPVCEEIKIVSKEHQYPDLGLDVVFDSQNSQTPLVGMLEGLKASNFEKNIVVACDMPFLSKEVLIFLAEQSSCFDGVVAEIAGRLEPLHGIYSKTAIPFIESSLNEKNFKVTSFFTHAKINIISEPEIKKLDKDLLSFFNINTLDDLKEAQKIARSNS